MNWIKCSDQMPDIEQEVLCIDDFGNYEAAVYTTGWFNNQIPFFAVTSGVFNPTHWQPLPEPPKE